MDQRSRRHNTDAILFAKFSAVSLNLVRFSLLLWFYLIQPGFFFFAYFVYLYTPVIASLLSARQDPASFLIIQSSSLTLRISTV